MYKCKNNNDCENDSLCCFSCNLLEDCKKKDWECEKMLDCENAEQCPYVETT